MLHDTKQLYITCYVVSNMGVKDRVEKGRAQVTFEYRKEVNGEAGKITCNQCGKVNTWSEWRMGMPLAASNMAKHLIKDHELMVYDGDETNTDVIEVLNKHRVKGIIQDYIEAVDNGDKF